MLANRWRREQLERTYFDALARLPEALAPSSEERAILLRTLVEIAAELGISISTVKRYLVRAGTQCYFALTAD